MSAQGPDHMLTLITSVPGVNTLTDVPTVSPRLMNRFLRTLLWHHFDDLEHHTTISQRNMAITKVPPPTSTTTTTTTPAFELISTIKKSKEDKIERELMACFQANKGKVTTLNYPVSDLIHVEVSKQQNQSDNNCSTRSGDGDNQKTAKKSIFKFFNVVNLCDKTTNPNNQANTELSDSQQISIPIPSKVIKRI